MTDGRANDLPSEEVQEKIRARKQRNRWGSVIFIVGMVAALVAAFWRGDYVLTSTFLLMALGGAGFVEPTALAKLFRRGE